MYVYDVMRGAIAQQSRTQAQVSTEKKCAALLHTVLPMLGIHLANMHS
jgi:hypothetical protein